MQKAFDQIVKNHLQKEIQETDLQDDSEEQFIENLNKCFEEKGILKELQIFLRQKLVSILKESSPEIVISSKGQILDSSVKLFTDWLISHKLLFTYSVLCSEIEDKYQLKEDLEKISKPDCETILAELGLSKGSGESQEILQFYFDNEYTSLLESILHFSSIKVVPILPPGSSEQSKSHANVNLLVNDSPGESASHQNNPAVSVSEKDEKSSEICEVSYTSIDLERIRDEIESRLRFELKDKEKELVQNFEQKLDILRKKFELEKIQWLEENQHQNQNQLKNDKNKMPIKELHNNCGEDLEKVLRKQIERNFLIKEAQLRSQIDRLMLENKKLLGQPIISRSSSSCHKSRHKSHHCHRPRSRNASEDYENGYFERNHQQNQMSNIDEDTIAMLQYRVECQAEEIESLKKVVNQSSQNSIKKPTQNKPTNDKNVHGSNDVQNCHFLANISGDSDMENFLQESKSRCEQIEKEAKVLENCLVELQMKTRSPSSNAAAAMVFGTGNGDTLNPFNFNIRPIPPRIPSDLRNFSPTISDQSQLSTPGCVKYQVYPSKSQRNGNKLSNHTIGIERIPKPKSNPQNPQRSRFGKYDENQHVSFIDHDHTTEQKPQSMPIPTVSTCDGKTFQNGVGPCPHEKDQEPLHGNKSSMSVIFFQRNEARLSLRNSSSISDNSHSQVDPDRDENENPSPKCPAVFSPEKESSVKSTHEEIMEEKASVAGALLKDKLTMSMRTRRESRESLTNSSKSSVKSLQSPPKSSIKPSKPSKSTENLINGQDKGQKVIIKSEIEPETQPSAEKSQPPQKVQNHQEPSPSHASSSQVQAQDHEQDLMDHHKVVQNGVKSQSSSSSSSSSVQSSLVILAPPALTDADQENFWDL